MFPEPPVIPFRPEKEQCDCRQRLLVRKTHRKTVLSMAGPFVALQTSARCPKCSRIFNSETLRRIVQPGCRTSYDVITFIGRSLFQRYRTTREIQDELLIRNIRISTSEINHLGRKFISYLALGHRLAVPRIRAKMELSGGYILHLDATHEGDCPALMSGMDGLSEMVLANVKIPSEKADHIVPFLEDLKKNYGLP
ncbi:MAG TPA: transposase, partial [Desulfobacterales bacterium]|nr:transposase [Desulfobacterales bacterium]